MNTGTKKAPGIIPEPFLCSQHNIHDEKCKGDDAQRDQHGEEHHLHGVGVGAELLLEGGAGTGATTPGCTATAHS